MQIHFPLAWLITRLICLSSTVRTKAIHHACCQIDPSGILYSVWKHQLLSLSFGWKDTEQCLDRTGYTAVCLVGFYAFISTQEDYCTQSKQCVVFFFFLWFHFPLLSLPPADRERIMLPAAAHLGDADGGKRVCVSHSGIQLVLQNKQFIQLRHDLAGYNILRMSKKKKKKK